MKGKHFPYGVAVCRIGFNPLNSLVHIAYRIAVNNCDIYIAVCYGIILFTWHKVHGFGIAPVFIAFVLVVAEHLNKVYVCKILREYRKNVAPQYIVAARIDEVARLNREVIIYPA